MHSSVTFVLAALASTALSSPLKARDVPTGQVITACSQPGTIAFTFDDGPSEYTSELLDLLAAYDAQATFFVLGSAASGSASLLQRMQSEGHQIGSHTYDHPSLIGLSDAQIEDQMDRLDDVLEQSIGERPTYMRPPYFDTDAHVLQVLGRLGYKVITASIDTKDYENNDEGQIEVSFDKFVTELDAGGSIVLSHDIHYWTVYKLAEEMLQEAESRGLRAVTVGECLGDPLGAWYR